LRLYLDDFKRYPSFLAGYPFTITTRSNYWDAQILPYAAGNKGVFLCPGLVLAGVPVTVSNNWNEGVLGPPGPPVGRRFPHPNESYGFNTYGVGVETDVNGRMTSYGLNTPSLFNSRSNMEEGYPDSAIRSPGEMIAVADYDPNYDDDGDGDHPDCLFSYTLTGKHHGGRAVVVFCDAHVEYAKTNSWGAPAYLFRSGTNVTTVRARWNNDHQPHDTVSWYP
jgi:prepilin-type processing-associated H-X9-DG protein